MTSREKKYHKRKYWMRFYRRVMQLSPEALAAEIKERKERRFKYATKHGIETSRVPISATIRITKYNMPNNQNLQRGQLN